MFSNNFSIRSLHFEFCCSLLQSLSSSFSFCIDVFILVFIFLSRSSDCRCVVSFVRRLNTSCSSICCWLLGRIPLPLPYLLRIIWRWTSPPIELTILGGETTQRDHIVHSEYASLPSRWSKKSTLTRLVGQTDPLLLYFHCLRLHYSTLLRFCCADDDLLSLNKSISTVILETTREFKSSHQTLLCFYKFKLFYFLPSLTTKCRQ